MKLTPRTLFGRTALLLVGLVLATQVLTLALFGALVVRPQSSRVVDIVAQSVSSVAAMLEALPPEKRAAFIEQFNASPYFDIIPGDRPPPVINQQPSRIERRFMQELVDRLHGQTEMDWRMGQRRILWVNIQIAGESYWVASRAPFLFRPRGATLLAAFGVGALVLLFGLQLSRQISRPLQDLQRAADGVSLGGLHQSLNLQGPAEIQALAASFNRMTERLASAERERAFILASVSHDLRTPLSKLRLAVEMIPNAGEMRDMAAQQVEQIDRMLSRFLDYARGFEAEPVAHFDLAALAREAASDIALEDSLSLTTPAQVPVHMRRDAIRRALVNLIENALTHGAAPVFVRVDQTPYGVEIVVRDSGRGAAERDPEQLTSAFRRGGNAGGKSGSGLGLAIVERVAQLHGGKLHLRNHPQGGFEARISLPLDPAREPPKAGA